MSSRGARRTDRAGGEVARKNAPHHRSAAPGVSRIRARGGSPGARWRQGSGRSGSSATSSPAPFARRTATDARRHGLACIVHHDACEGELPRRSPSVRLDPGRALQANPGRAVRIPGARREHGTRRERPMVASKIGAWTTIGHVAATPPSEGDGTLKGCMTVRLRTTAARALLAVATAFARPLGSRRGARRGRVQFLAERIKYPPSAGTSRRFSRSDERGASPRRHQVGRRRGAAMLGARRSQ